MPERIDLQEVVSALQKRGASISEGQLQRWQRSGLIPKPTKVGLGRGKGIHATYPDGVIPQALALNELLAIKRDFHWVGWRLWVNGFDVDQHYWLTPLEAAATRFDGFIHKLRDDEDGDGETRFEIANHLWESPDVPKEWKTIRKALGHDRHESFVFMVLDIGSGRFTDWPGSYDAKSSDAKHDRRSMQVGLGIHNGFTDKIAGIGALIVGDIRPELAGLSQALSQMAWRQRLKTTGHSDLRETARELFGIMQVVSGLTAFLEQTFGLKNAFGLGRIARIAKNTPPEIEAYMVLGWLALRENDDVKSGVRDILNAVRHAAEKQDNQLAGTQITRTRPIT